jgi:adenine phosphoribosyltransferase
VPPAGGHDRDTVGSVATEDFRRHLADRFPLVDGHPDVAGVLRDALLLAGLGPALAGPYHHSGVTKVMAPEARGPILGALVATELRAGLVLARKEGQNHPGADAFLVTEPTWRGVSQRFLTRTADIEPHDRVLLVDDWVTSGNSAAALWAWVEGQGAEVVGTAVLVDKSEPDVAQRLRLHALVRFADLVP